MPAVLSIGSGTQRFLHAFCQPGLEAVAVFRELALIRVTGNSLSDVGGYSLVVSDPAGSGTSS
ncbi:hypothetical protein THITH_08330 [Thioalkalivibrio paradoxus ARh 1]|uniref:Uncharacterized protein n=1 Tax=Thioalkalivibrio paradoxus ARh 1 TaxID=713585 RepID=W0DN92_9GAMM|nr:hypothetical protein THITH_08330 [Thioalkalivibrio paradoxus ARh 1]